LELKTKISDLKVDQTYVKVDTIATSNLGDSDFLVVQFDDNSAAILDNVFPVEPIYIPKELLSCSADNSSTMTVKYRDKEPAIINIDINRQLPSFVVRNDLSNEPDNFKNLSIIMSIGGKDYIIGFNIIFQTDTEYSIITPCLIGYEDIVKLTGHKKYQINGLSKKFEYSCQISLSDNKTYIHKPYYILPKRPFPVAVYFAIIYLNDTKKYKQIEIVQIVKKLFNLVSLHQSTVSRTISSMDKKLASNKSTNYTNYLPIIDNRIDKNIIDILSIDIINTNNDEINNKSDNNIGINNEDNDNNKCTSRLKKLKTFLNLKTDRIRNYLQNFIVNGHINIAELSNNWLKQFGVHLLFSCANPSSYAAHKYFIHNFKL
jgi:hypothetical protein